MNKLAEQGADALQKLIEAVQSASPAVWAAAQAKVQADILANQWLVKMTLSIEIVLGAWLILCLVWAFNEHAETDLVALGGFPFVIGTIFCAVFGITAKMQLISLQAAPNWHAIQLIMSQVK